MIFCLSEGSYVQLDARYWGTVVLSRHPDKERKTEPVFVIRFKWVLCVAVRGSYKMENACLFMTGV